MSNIPDNIKKMWEAAAYGGGKFTPTPKGNPHTTNPVKEKPLSPEALKALEKKTNLKFDPKLTGEK